MRPALRLLAAVKPKYLEAGAPTGLTGLFTHPTPRSTLLFFYNSTLEKLKQIPESSVYRQSTEALTKQRLAIVESIKPDGWDAWHEKALKQVEKNPGAVGPEGTLQLHEIGGQRFVSMDTYVSEPDERYIEWDGEKVEEILEGPRDPHEVRDQAQQMGIGKEWKLDESRRIKFDPEPRLTADQTAEMENKIGAGLIEEVVAVAEGEDKLADVMIENKVWEPIVEKAPEGQWIYFERQHQTET